MNASKNWGRFTQLARRVLSYAQEEAERLNHNYIGSEHVLIGLIREDGGVAGRVLRSLGLDVSKVQKAVEKLSGSGVRTPYTKIELSPETKRILELAVEEAKQLGQHYVGTEHLLLGLVRQNQGAGMDVLRGFRITAEKVRSETKRALQQNPPEKVTAGGPSGRRRKKGSKKKGKSDQF